MICKKDLWRKRAKANLAFLDASYGTEKHGDKHAKRKKMASTYYGKIIPTVYSDFLGILGLIKYLVF
mgnify:FL=1